MKKKQIIKMVTDILMTIILLLLMSYLMIGSELHEWQGAGMFVLLVLHHVLNIWWVKNLFRGKYTPFRILQTAVLGLVFVCVISSVYSGIVLSRYVFADFPVAGSKSMARIIHMLSAYWGFLFMGIHLGLHWNMVVGMVGRHWKTDSKAGRILPKIIAVLIAGYGIYAFIRRKIFSYLFLQTRFAFFDTGESLVLFLIDYLAIFAFFVCIGHYSAKLARSQKSSNEL